MKLNFKPGDVIQNIEPYDKESPNLVISFDHYGYLCATKGYKDPDGDWNLRNLNEICFEPAHTRYSKIGYVKVNLNITVEE